MMKSVEPTLSDITRARNRLAIDKHFQFLG